MRKTVFFFPSGSYMALQVEVLRKEEVLMRSRTRLQREAAFWGRSLCSGRRADAWPGTPRGGEGRRGLSPPNRPEERGTGGAADGVVPVHLCGHRIIARCDRRSLWPVCNARVP